MRRLQICFALCASVLSIRYCDIVANSAYDVLQQMTEDAQLVTQAEYDLIGKATAGEFLTHAQKRALVDICERIQQYDSERFSYDDIRQIYEHICADFDRAVREPRPDTPFSPDPRPQSTVGTSQISDTSTISKLTNLSQITPASGGLSIDLGPIQSQPLSTASVTTQALPSNTAGKEIVYGTNGFLYVAGLDTAGVGNPGIVMKFDPRDLSGPLDTYAPPDIVNALEFGSDGYLYVGGFDDSSGTPRGIILQFNPNNLSSPLASVSTSDNIRSLAFGADGFLYAGTDRDNTSTTIIKFNPHNLNNQVDTGSTSDRVVSLAFGPDGFLYVGTDGSELLKFDPSDLSSGSVDSSSMLDSVTAIAFGPDEFLYATYVTGSFGNFEGNIDKFDPSDLSGQVDSVSYSSSVFYTLVVGPNKYLYVGVQDLSSGAGAVLQFDPSDLSSSSVARVSTSDLVEGLVFGPNGSLYGTGSSSLIEVPVIDFGDQLAISNVAPAEDLQKYQLMLVANDGSRIRRSVDTADEFQNIITSTAYAKRNIGTVDDAFHDLMHVKPISFQYRADKDDGNMHFGVRAEELAQYVPELVRYDAYGNPERVRYIEMVPLLLKALQEQEKALHAREQENADLYDRVARLEELMAGFVC